MKITDLVKDIWHLLNEMSPYLLFGFLIAGFLHILISKEKIYKHFAKNNLLSIIKASLFGVPLPLCSCGVIPVAAHLRKQGAGKSSTMSFLISTPTTGVDSIMATYALLGPLFAVIRPIAAFFGGILGGVINNLFIKKKENKKMTENISCTVCEIDAPHVHTLKEKIIVMLKYGFFDLIESTWKWLMIGIIAGGLISFLVPDNLIEQYLGNPFISYTLMVLIAVPMYVCATGSIPIAASLILKGMAPGAGLVFLIAGPATNTATLSFVGGKLGKKSLIIYLLTIIITALLFGILVDYIWISSGKDINLLSAGMKMLPGWIKTSSAILLVLLIIKAMLHKHGKKITGTGMVFKVPDITCEHCVKTIYTALAKVKGIKDIRIDLKKKQVEVTGDMAKNLVISTIKKAGYTAEEIKK